MIISLKKYLTTPNLTLEVIDKKTKDSIKIDDNSDFISLQKTKNWMKSQVP